MSSRNWLAVSAPECTASANIEAAPVRRKPTSLATAMPALAARAAKIAFRLPSCTGPFLVGGEQVAVAEPAERRGGELPVPVGDLDVLAVDLEQDPVDRGELGRRVDDLGQGEDL